MHLDHLNWLSGSKIKKKYIQGTKVRCPKLLELKKKKESHIFKVDYFEKIEKLV